MPPPLSKKPQQQQNNNQNSKKKAKASSSSSSIPQFKSTKNKHVSGNPSIGDFSFALDKKKEISTKKVGKFVPRSQRLKMAAEKK